MKQILWYVMALLCLAVVVTALPVRGEEGIYDSVIRLHVLAASDSEEDQALKLAVRDAILTTYSARLAEAESVGDAEAEVMALCNEIQKTAETVVKAEGYAYPVSVYYGEEGYPTREYGAYSFPAGYYRSLRIVIGEGAGENWWCVLFPPLCLDLATEALTGEESLAVGLSPGEHDIILGGEKGSYRVKFKALELLEGIFSIEER